MAKLPIAILTDRVEHWLDTYKRNGRDTKCQGNNPRVSGETLTKIRDYLIRTGQAEK